MNELPDRLLRGALREKASAAPSDLCADADALAAWADGTMSRPARAAFEAHAADCARCLALMAAMARTEPSPVESASWRRSPFFWLIVPLAAAAAALVIVVDLARTERSAPAPVSSVARQESTAAATVPPPKGEGGSVAPAATIPAAPAPAETSPHRADARRDERAATARNGRQHLTASIQDAAAAAQPAEKTEPRAKAGSPTAPPVAAPVPAPPSSTPAAAPAPPLPAPAASATEAPAGRAVPPAVGDPVSVARDVPRARDASRSELATSRALAAKAIAAAAPTVIVSPDRDSQWRIVDGAIEHTVDGGRTWQAQPLGTTAPIRAGTAPAARVCWLVGAGGAVMLTTDGVTWRRIAFPDAVDLAAIQASDDAHATVTTAIGRSYLTSDGGKTWTPR